MVSLAEIQSASGVVGWGIKFLTLLLAYGVYKMAEKPKYFNAMIVAIAGFLIFVFLSPLVSIIISLTCMIWISRAKVNFNDPKEPSKPRVQPGQIIGLIIGIGLSVSPFIGIIRQEASMYDPTNTLLIFGFAMFGIMMITSNILYITRRMPVGELIKEEKKEVKVEKKEEDTTGKIRCRFCKKLYSLEYNGCPYCKKK